MTDQIATSPIVLTVSNMRGALGPSAADVARGAGLIAPDATDTDFINYLAALASDAALASIPYFATVDAGEAGTVLDELFATDEGGGDLVYYRRTASGSVEIEPAFTPSQLDDYATKAGTETLSGKTLAGATRFATNGARIGITNAVTPIAAPQALVNIVNDGAVSVALRVSSYWTGSTATPYQNNDDSLYEVFNNVTSDSLNRSWAGSFPNAYNNIPEEVTDSGERTGLIGWAVSVSGGDYVHAGTLVQQLGVYGVAGFQGPDSPATAVINNATGVRGFIYNDSPGATIVNAYAGEFISTAVDGVVENNVAVFAAAAFGTATNYAFYGNGGLLYNQDQILAGGLATQSASRVAARHGGNSYEWGNPDTNGFGSNIGSTASSGYSFIVYCGEADPTGDTFRTRGKKGSVIFSGLDGTLIFARLTNANASGQTPAESMRIDPAGNVILSQAAVLRSRTPASSTDTGIQGEIAWDVDYFHVCVGTNSWKRIALSSW